ncbi:MAG: hypothetical protein RL521_860 [Bacteroidota bacterium]|jgi:hypothetical protein
MRYLLVLLVFWAVWMEFPRVAFQDPSGIHFIRQTDGLAFASYYFEREEGFFNSGTLNLSSDEGHVACELPVFYYLTAQIYHYTGIYFPILRWMHGGIVLLGIFHVFLFWKKWAENVWMPMLMMLLLLTSVVFSYYAFNFLPDAPAWSFIMMGWYYGVEFLDMRRLKWGLVAFSLFALGALLKPTFFIHAVAFLGTMMFVHHTAPRNRNEWRFALIGFGCALIAVSLWSWRIIQFNAANHDDYFLVSTRPIWKMDSEDIRVVWDHMTGYWFRDYFARDMWRWIGVMLLMVVLRWNKIKPVVRHAFWILTIGELSYIVLFFGQFKDHDYYAWNIFPWFIWLAAAFIDGFWSALHHKLSQYAVGLVLLVLGCTSWQANEKVIRWRFAHEEPNLAWVGKRLKNGPEWFKSAGILPFTEKVVVVPDFTRNGSLLFIQQEGWTLADSTQLNRLEDPALASATKLLVLDSNYLDFSIITDSWIIQKRDTVNEIYLLTKR